MPLTVSELMNLEPCDHIRILTDIPSAHALPSLKIAVMPIVCDGESRRERESMSRDILVRHLFPPETNLIHLPSGKPVLSGIAIPKDSATSISHSRDYVALSFSSDGDTGIDIESVDRESQLEKVAPRFLSPEELVCYSDIPHGLLLAWTAKEAAFKASAIHPVDFISDIKLPPAVPASQAPDGQINYIFCKDIFVSTSLGEETICIRYAALIPDGQMICSTTRTLVPH